MLEIDRRREIVRILQSEETATVESLTQRLDASPATIRRDLQVLENDGAIERVRGGARIDPSNAGIQSRYAALRSYWPPQIRETDLSYRIGINPSQKAAIAKAAVDLIEPDEAIIMDGSSTTFAMTRFMDSIDTKVLTNSFAVAGELLRNGSATVVLSGGIIYPDSMLAYDPTGSGVFTSFYASKLFMGVKGIDQRGLRNSDMLLIRMDQEMIEKAEQLIVLADSSKFGQRGELLLCGIERVHTIITDSGIPDWSREFLETTDVRLMIVE